MPSAHARAVRGGYGRKHLPACSTAAKLVTLGAHEGAGEGSRYARPSCSVGGRGGYARFLYIKVPLQKWEPKHFTPYSM
jgi:hypothetical protein